MSVRHTVQANAANGERGLIDIHLPETGGELWPFVLGIHGGGWRDGDRRSYTWGLDALLGQGFAVVLCSYRVLPEFAFPACYDDLVQLLRWLNVHAAEHGLVRERCALLGGSAGGHLACLLSTRGVREAGDIVPVRATVAYCPVLDMRDQYENNRRQNRNTVETLLGGSPQDNPAGYDAASPALHIHEAMPPLWLAHGDADPVVLMATTTAFVEAMRERGVMPARYHIVRGQGHSMKVKDAVPAAFVEQADMFAFLREQLKGAATMR